MLPVGSGEKIRLCSAFGQNRLIYGTEAERQLERRAWSIVQDRRRFPERPRCNPPIAASALAELWQVYWRPIIYAICDGPVVRRTDAQDSPPQDFLRAHANARPLRGCLAQQISGGFRFLSADLVLFLKNYVFGFRFFARRGSKKRAAGGCQFIRHDQVTAEEAIGLNARDRR